MSERQATLHDERIDLLSAMVVDLRARLATAEAERDQKDAALKGLVEHIERMFGDVTHPSMAVRALRIHARAAALDGKP